MNKEQKLVNIIETLNLGTYEWEIQTGKVTFNETWAKMVGYSVNELDSNIETWKKLTHPDDFKQSEELLELLFSKKISFYELEFRLKHKNGEWLWMLSKGGVALWSPDGKPLLMIGSQIDITQIKQTNELLKQQTKDLKESQRISHLGTWRLDIKTNKVFWSEELYKMYGFDPLLPVPDYTEHMKLFTPESWEKLSTSLALTSSKGVPYELELETVTKDGSNGWMWVRGEAEKDKNGDIVAIWGAAQDITERNKILEQSRQNERNLLESQKIAKIGSWRLDAKTNQVEWTEELYKMYGFDPTLPPPDLTEHRKMFTPESWEKLSNSIDLATTKGIPYELEIQTFKNDGTKGWMWTRAEIEKNKNGEIIAIHGVAQDITERKQLIEQLKQKEKQLLDSQIISQVGTFRLDLKTKEIEWTDEIYKMFGIDPTLPALPYETQMKTYTKESWEKLSSAVDLTTKKGIGYALELEIVRQDGSNGWIWVKGEAEKDKHGKIIAVLGVAQDITERINTLNKLKESQELLDMFFKQSLTGFFVMMLDEPVFWNENVNKEEVLEYIFDHQRCIRVNEAYLAQYGMSQEDFLLKTPRDMFAHDLDQGKDAWRQMLDHGLIHTITDEVKYDGTHMFIEGDYVCMYDSIGRFAGHFGNQQDVTLRIQKQNEIKYVGNHDYLTDLYNRRYYFEQFNQYDKPEYYPLGIMMLDVNGLKIINDAFGHAAGDNAIKTLGNILKDTFEQKDIVSRIGGDEFAVLLLNTSSDKLLQYKEQISLAIKNMRVENVELSLAIGFELKKSIEEDADDILKLAENHMYRHKSIIGSSSRSHAISAILETLTDKYDNERVHSERVSHLCKLIGQQLRLREDEIKELEQAGMFHDIGKISIPDSILDKPGKLTDEEYEIIKTHTEVGYQILRAADEYSDLAIQALHHHERWDGNGYPSGMMGNDIPLFSRIIAVVDAYEAMTADRPYRKKLSEEYAISEIKRCSGKQFDPRIARIFIEKVLNASWK